MDGSRIIRRSYSDNADLIHKEGDLGWENLCANQLSDDWLQKLFRMFNSLIHAVAADGSVVVAYFYWPSYRFDWLSNKDLDGCRRGEMNHATEEGKTSM